MLYVHEKCKLSDFVFQVNAATYLRCGRQPNMDFVGNLLIFAAVKEICKLIKNLQSYSHG